jgi:hypothetical protein
MLGSDAGTEGDVGIGGPDATSPSGDRDAGDATSADGGSEVSFGPVAELVRQKCARAGCHAGSSASGVGNFKVPDSNASDEVIARALRDQPLEGEDGKVVVPGDPQKSGLYLYITGDRMPLMPIGGTLPDDQIELVRRWIAAGAPYE